MEVGARSQGYTFAAAVDDTMACRQSKTPPLVEVNDGVTPPANYGLGMWARG